MMLAKDIAILIVSVFVIVKGAVWLVDSSAIIAKRMGISELVIGLTVIAFGTSAPEFAVSILSASKNLGDISIGNIVGSNIFNLGFILGGTAMICALQTNKSHVKRDGGFLLLGSVLLLFFLWDLKLSLYEGVFFLLLLVVYLGYLYWKKEPMESEVRDHSFGWKDPVLLVVGLIMILGGSHFLVESATSMAKQFGVSEWAIGVTIVAAGTSAPEFATSIIAALRGHHGISVGNLIGSDIFNMFGVLGVVSVMKTLTVDVAARSNIIALAVMVLIVVIFMFTGSKVSKKEGSILFSIGLVRWIMSLT